MNAKLKLGILALGICIVLSLVIYFISTDRSNNLQEDSLGTFVVNDRESDGLIATKLTSVVATLDCPLPKHQNIIYCSTFKMAWDKMKDDIIGEPIQILGAEKLAARLNKAKVSDKALEEESFYATVGFVEKGIIEEIQKKMAKRFPSEHVPVFDERYTNLPHPILAYSYLKVDVGFKYPFYTNNGAFSFADSNGKQTDVRSFCSFGGDPNSWLLLEQVDILSYKYEGLVSDTEFVVDLCKHTQPYQVVLALVPSRDTLGKIVASVEDKISKFKRDPDYRILCKLRPIDRLIVPDVLYKLIHHFNELIGKNIGNQPWRDKGYFIFEAMQMIDFSLSRTGVILKSEARIGGATGRIKPRRIDEPRHLYFNRPFLIYVKKRGTEYSPFFTMWVDNAEFMEEFK